jgi:L-ascorbate metabolism protein UlaG (beta-lactamase superfamily)
MGEKGAVRAASSLAPKVIIPMHLGLKPRSPFLRTSQTAETFRKRAREAGLKSEVKVLREGESWDA